MPSSGTNEAILWNALFEGAWDGMVVMRRDGSLYRANRRYAEMLGYRREELESMHVWDLDTRFSRRVILAMLHRVDSAGAHFETQQRRQDGSLIDVELSNNAATFEGDKLIFCVVRDITARRATEARLRQSEALLRGIASQVPGALYQYRMAPDGSRSFPYFSQGIVELGGLPLEEIWGPGTETAMSRILPEDAERVEAQTRHSAATLSQVHVEFRALHADGSIRWIECRSTPQQEADGGILWTGILLDITQRKLAEARVQTMAITDGLTGITNRQELGRLLEKEMARASRYASPLSLIMYDLDHFKRINDRFGHNSGDDVLKTVARLVNDSLRGIDHHGRWGGEEFMVLLPETGLAAASKVAEKLRRAIAGQRFETLGTVTASFGVVELADGEDSRSLVQRVDEALYRAKELGRNRVEARASRQGAQ
ncbi:diguanylate cyclase [Halomonas sp. SSL-5]|uniref:sensor domain-containing diguanylate cyclase n=1 Tax=Halomonas sp. SSL-5 TaxID=3065855 RepID=UPI002739888B|nr:sensor domain-containing diguanylate cyclase [Halomonas sp. SSL-5]MDY7116837.1 diguanylate cyclase [Halomonas sp. SSL-5]